MNSKNNLGHPRHFLRAETLSSGNASTMVFEHRDRTRPRVAWGIQRLAKILQLESPPGPNHTLTRIQPLHRIRPRPFVSYTKNGWKPQCYIAGVNRNLYCPSSHHPSPPPPLTFVLKFECKLCIHPFIRFVPGHPCFSCLYLRAENPVYAQLDVFGDKLLKDLSHASHSRTQSHDHITSIWRT
jgi:hypothetical protein